MIKSLFNGLPIHDRPNCFEVIYLDIFVLRLAENI